MLRTWWILTGIAIVAGILWVLAQQDIGPPTVPGVTIPTDESMRPFEASLEHWRSTGPDARAAYARYFLALVEQKRAALTTRIDAAAEARDKAVQNTLSDIFAVLLLTALGFVFLPLFVGHRYRGRRRRLWLYTLVAVLLLVLALLLFWALLLMLREVTAVASRGVNPERSIVEAGFDYLQRQAGRIAQGDDPDDETLPLGPVVGSLERDPSGGFAANLLRNLRYFDTEAFETAARWTSHGYRMLRFLPHIIPYLLLVLFFFTLRDVLREILSMPLRAASGERRVARRAIGLVLKTLWREFLSILVLFGCVLVLTLGVKLCVHSFTHRIIDWTVLHVESTVHYLGLLDRPPDRTGLFVGLMSVPVCMALTVLCIAVGVTGATFWARRLTQLRFHAGVRLRAHHGFWRKATMSVLRVQWIPVLALWLFLPLARDMARNPAPATADDAVGLLWRLALLSIGGLCAALVLFGGVRAALYFLTFRPTRPDPQTPAPRGDVAGDP